MAAYTTAITDIGDSLKILLQGGKEYRLIPKEKIETIQVVTRKSPFVGYILPLTPVGYVTGAPEVMFDVNTTLDGTTYGDIDSLATAIDTARSTGGGGGTGTDINLKEVGGVSVNIGAGNASTGTQRVSISTNDVNLSAIKTSVELQDNSETLVNSIPVKRVMVTDDTGNQITSFGSPSTIATHRSPIDFNATCAAAGAVVTLSGHVAPTNNAQIVYIRKVPLTGSNATVYVNGAGGITMTYAANVITVDGAGASPFAMNDVVEVGINYQDKGHDATIGANLSSITNPVFEQYTEVESLLAAAYELTSTPADVCSEIDVRGYNYLTFWIQIDINLSTDVRLRILHKHTSEGTEEYREIYLGSPAANITTINLNDYEINSDADQFFKITLSVTGTAFVQLQAYDANNSDGQIDTLYCTKTY